ncbi:hypothetical protein QTP88_008285 [Uroleucon formosanum]
MATKRYRRKFNVNQSVDSADGVVGTSVSDEQQNVKWTAVAAVHGPKCSRKIRNSCTRVSVCLCTRVSVCLCLCVCVLLWGRGSGGGGCGAVCAEGICDPIAAVNTRVVGIVLA